VTGCNSYRGIVTFIDVHRHKLNPGLTQSAHEGSATRACGRFGFAYTLIAPLAGHIERLSRGDGPRLRDRGRNDVSSPFDRSRSWLDPVTTLMVVCITVFHAGNGEYGVSLRRRPPCGAVA
jgi:hypothetical protein